MGELLICDAAVPTERDRWQKAWQSWPGREVFAHPGYVQLFVRPNDRAMCAILPAAAGGVLFPFILRPLAGEPWAQVGEPACDLVSPYGYGGAFAWNCTEDQKQAFGRGLAAWAKSQAVASSFVRLSLFAEQQIPLPGEVAVDRPNVVRSLHLNPDELWQDFEHKVRKNVKCAKRSGLTTEIDLTGRRLEDFLAIYYSTMERRGADGAYYFPRDFFESILRDLAGQFAFFHVLSGTRVVSTELVLVSADNLYSFLGGTLGEAFAQRPNDLLKHEIILWGQQAGKRAFVLGGGYAADDGIYRYKKSFAPHGSRPFCVGKQVHDSVTYDRLVRQRRGWELSRGNAWTPRPDYFPAYRA